MLLPPLSAPCPPCQRDAAVRVVLSPAPGDAGEGQDKGTGLSAIPLCARSQAGTWSSKSMCGWSRSLSRGVMRLDYLWSHPGAVIPWSLSGLEENSWSALEMQRHEAPSLEIPSTFQDGIALMWYLQCHEEPQGSSEDVSDPHPTFTALSPTAFSAPSFAPEAPGKPFPFPPHSPQPGQLLLVLGCPWGRGCVSSPSLAFPCGDRREWQ